MEEIRLSFFSRNPEIWPIFKDPAIQAIGQFRQQHIEMGDVLFGNTSFGFTLYDTEADSVNTMPISIKVNVTGPNGKTSASIFGITN